MGYNNAESVRLEDETLIEYVRLGDMKAFEVLYNRYINRLYAKVMKMVKLPEIAEELTQETFLRVWEFRHALERDKSFNAYISTIARNLVYRFFNEQVRERGLEAALIARSTELYHPLDELIAFNESSQIIAKAIQTLPLQRRNVYTLCKIEGKSYQEVSSQLGISTSTISDHIVKATKFLRAYYLAEQQILFLFFLFFY